MMKETIKDILKEKLAHYTQCKESEITIETLEYADKDFEITAFHTDGDKRYSLSFKISDII